MADEVVKLTATTVSGLEQELHTYEIGLQLKDIGSDGSKNYALYNVKNVIPDGAIKLLPDVSVPPANADYIEKGPLVLGGVKQIFRVYRVPKSPGE